MVLSWNIFKDMGIDLSELRMKDLDYKLDFSIKEKDHDKILSTLKEKIPSMIIIKGYTPLMKPIFSLDYFLSYIKHIFGVHPYNDCYEWYQRQSWKFTPEGYRYLEKE